MEPLLMLAVAISLVCIIGMALMYGYANKKCKHVWMNVLEDGFQYCDLCGTAQKPIDETYARECKHKFVGIKTVNITTNRHGEEGHTGYLYVLRCENCGDITHRKVQV